MKQKKLVLVGGCSFSESKGCGSKWIPWTDIANKELQDSWDVHNTAQGSIGNALISNKINSNKILKNSKNWKIFLEKMKLKPHKKHIFKSNINKKNKVNFLKINIFPDGGISRIRAFGKVVK